MQLTEKQLKIQERADKTLSFWCIVERYKGKYETFACLKAYSLYLEYAVVDGTHLYKETTSVDSFQKIKIIGHPMNRARLTYLRITKCSLHSPEAVKKSEPYFNDLHDYFYNNEETLIQTVLERPEELLDLVIAFLDTLPKDEL